MLWDQPCEHEEAVRLMARRIARGAAPIMTDETLRAHAVTCQLCQETLAVGAWMQQLATASISSAPLPDPQYLWWKAELLRRWRAEQRATSAIDTGEQMQVGLGLAAAGGLLLWMWHSLSTLAPGSSTVTIAMITSGVLLVGAAGVLLRNLVVKP